jgi:hypothetical protein
MGEVYDLAGSRRAGQVVVRLFLTGGLPLGSAWAPATWAGASLLSPPDPRPRQ